MAREWWCYWDCIYPSFVSVSFKEFGVVGSDTYTWGIKDFHKCWLGPLAKRRLCLGPAGVKNCTSHLHCPSAWVCLPGRVATTVVTAPRRYVPGSCTISVKIRLIYRNLWSRGTEVKPVWCCHKQGAAPLHVFSRTSWGPWGAGGRPPRRSPRRKDPASGQNRHGLAFGHQAWWTEILVAQSCLTLCNPTDCKPPSSSVHGILQARILEGVAVSVSRGSSHPRNGIRVCPRPGGSFTVWATREARRLGWALLV